MAIPGHSLDTPVEDLEWVANLGAFKFRVDKADIDFWTVGWLTNFLSLELSDQSWDRKYVYFLITAEEAVEDAGPVKAAKEPELPLHVMHHRESQVSKPPTGTKPRQVSAGGKYNYANRASIQQLSPLRLPELMFSTTEIRSSEDDEFLKNSSASYWTRMWGRRH